MRSRKTFIVIFLLAFLLGCLAVWLTNNTSAPAKSEKPQTNEVKEDNIFLEFAELKVETEILEENEDREDEERFKIKLLETGEGFHGDEIEAKSGEIWLGLFQENDSYFLRKTKIKVTRVEDVIVDDPGEKTGKSVSTDIKNTPLFLLKNAEMLRDGKVDQLYDGDWYYDEETGERSKIGESLRADFAREFKIRGKTFTLRVKKGQNKDRKPIAALVLESEGVRQTLHSTEIPEGDDAYLGEIYWVGDLDNDGKLDLYIHLFIHENATYRNLFLSSPAKKGKLVKKVAVFTTSGC